MKKWAEVNICKKHGDMFFDIDKLNSMEVDGWNLFHVMVDPRFPMHGYIINGLFWKEGAEAVVLDEPRVARPSIDDLDVPTYPKKRGRPPLVSKGV